MTRIRTLFLSAGVLGLAACATTPTEPAATAPAAPQAESRMATASTVHNAKVNLSAASGSLVSGTLDVMAMGDGLHLTGELTNVDGECGGYNLMYAFMSGLKAGCNGRKLIYDQR